MFLVLVLLSLFSLFPENPGMSCLKWIHPAQNWDVETPINPMNFPEGSGFLGITVAVVLGCPAWKGDLLIGLDGLVMILQVKKKQQFPQVPKWWMGKRLENIRKHKKTCRKYTKHSNRNMSKLLFVQAQESRETICLLVISMNLRKLSRGKLSLVTIPALSRMNFEGVPFVARDDVPSPFRTAGDSPWARPTMLYTIGFETVPSCALWYICSGFRALSSENSAVAKSSLAAGAAFVVTCWSVAGLPVTRHSAPRREMSRIPTDVRSLCSANHHVRNLGPCKLPLSFKTITTKRYECKISNSKDITSTWSYFHYNYYNWRKILKVRISFWVIFVLPSQWKKTPFLRKLLQHLLLPCSELKL